MYQNPFEIDRTKQLYVDLFKQLIEMVEIADEKIMLVAEHVDKNLESIREIAELAHYSNIILSITFVAAFMALVLSLINYFRR